MDPLAIERLDGSAVMLRPSWIGSHSAWRWQTGGTPRLTGTERRSAAAALAAWLERHGSSIVEPSIELVRTELARVGWGAEDGHLLEPGPAAAMEPAIPPPVMQLQQPPPDEQLGQEPGSAQPAEQAPPHEVEENDCGGSLLECCRFTP